MSRDTIGFLLIDKDSGWTSHDVVAKCRGILGIKKVGHAGTLDPMATGLLVLGIGRATRLLRFVQDFAKEYLATVQFGVATDSLDADGAVLSREPMPVTEDDVRTAMTRFVGDIMQQPPMVSARKVEGRRLYELAREGKEVERESRPVTIHSFDLLDFAPSDYPEAQVRVVASKGTYVRTLGDDLARALGGRAHLTALRRVRNGSLDVSDAVTIEQLQGAEDAGGLLIDPGAALGALPAVEVDETTAQAVRNGVPLAAGLVGDVSGLVRVLDESARLLAVYRAEDRRARPEVVLG
ncbi:MAG: tRNA pseudouridine(55) synthase TruB [Acidimicrobiia bacterium]|nr:tRNA pseudouridine(55) synthase TruB [Acidimicrobiia bacterium]